MRSYEDFHPGLLIRHPLGRTITAADNAWFTLLTVNSNPIHFDRHYAAQTEFGQPLVNSTFTLALVTGLTVADEQAGVEIFVAPHDFSRMVRAMRILAASIMRPLKLAEPRPSATARS